MYYRPMKNNPKITIKETRENLATILDQVEYQGKTFTITKYGRPVAEVKPFKMTKEIEEFLAKEKEEKRQKRKAALKKLFGIWKDRKDIKDSASYVAEMRKPRYELDVD